MDGFTGMTNPEKVRDVADRLRRQAQRLDTSASEVEQVTASLSSHWSGEDAQVFRRRAPRMVEDVTGAAELVRGLAAQLYAELQAQVEASAVDDFHGSGPAGPLSGTTEVHGTQIPIDNGAVPPGSELLALLGLDGGWVPQGLDVDASGELTLTTLYNADNPGEGVLVIQDREGNIVNTVQLSGSDHYGGVAVHGDHVWVSGDGKVQLYSLSEIRAADRGSPVDPHDSFPIEGSSTVTYHDGQLWTAQFDSDHEMQVHAYDVNGRGEVGDAPAQTLGGTKEMQGIAVNDRYIYLSGSEGRDSEDSVLTRIDRHSGERESISVPSNMAEGIALRGDDLITTYESGAETYDDGREPRSTTSVRHLR